MTKQKQCYKLIKLSSKGFELSTTDLQLIFNTLADYICSSCTMTKSDIEKYVAENRINVEEAEYMLEDAFPEDEIFNNLPLEERIEWLLSTSCGCEFAFYKFDSFHEMMLDEKENIENYFQRNA